MMIVPVLLTILRAGCEGHVADQQPHYKIYTTTGNFFLALVNQLIPDETVSFDVLPVCFATSTAGPLWAITYYAAQLLYTSIGPMVCVSYSLFHLIIDHLCLLHLPVLRRRVPFHPEQAISLLCRTGGLLRRAIHLPLHARRSLLRSFLTSVQLGTKIITLFRYVSQASVVHILCFVVIFLIYGK